MRKETVSSKKASEDRRKLIGVPKKLWKQMGRLGQLICYIMWDGTATYDVVKHPKSPDMDPKHWETVRYNIAVVAGLYMKEIGAEVYGVRRG